VLVHTITCKGKGYCMAEENPAQYHGIGPFDVQTGAVEKSEGQPTYTAVFGKTMVKLAAKDERIVAVTAAMEYGTGLAEFARLFPGRFSDVGIAEQHGVIYSAGLAKEGYRPVVAIYSTFIQRGYDHIIHDVCMQKFPVVFAMDRAGIVGEDGPTHHGVFDIAFTRSVPYLTVMAPSDEDELADMLATAVVAEGPCAIRYPRAHGVGVPLKKEPSILPIGRGRMIAEGDDLLIIAVGSMVAPAVEAAHAVAQEGISVGVLDPRFIKPLDRELILAKASSVGKVLVVEEGVLAGGFGSAILELFSDENLPGIRTVRLGIPDTFVQHGSREELLADLGLTADGIAEQARAMVEGTSVSRMRGMAHLRGRPH